MSSRFEYGRRLVPRVCMELTKASSVCNQHCYYYCHSSYFIIIIIIITSGQYNYYFVVVAVVPHPDAVCSLTATG